MASSSGPVYFLPTPRPARRWPWVLAALVAVLVAAALVFAGYQVLRPRGTPTSRALSGTWEGDYDCAQGITGLRLTLLARDKGLLLATFAFHPVPENSAVPTGSFAMRGSYSTNALVLRQDYWIDQPAGYLMVDLSSTYQDRTPSTLTGRIGAGTGCGDFTVRKVSGRTHPPAPRPTATAPA